MSFEDDEARLAVILRTYIDEYIDGGMSNLDVEVLIRSIKYRDDALLQAEKVASDAIFETARNVYADTANLAEKMGQASGYEVAAAIRALGGDAPKTPTE